MNTILLLYYRAPYADNPALICACGTADAAVRRIYQLHSMYPDAYPEMSRFETTRVEYYEGVVTN